MCNIFQARNREFFRRVFPELGHLMNIQLQREKERYRIEKRYRFAGKHLKIAF